MERGAGDKTELSTARLTAQRWRPPRIANRGPKLANQGGVAGIEHSMGFRLLIGT